MMSSNKKDLKKDIEFVNETLKRYTSTPGHGLPQTRRDFLTTGLMAAATTLAPASIVSLLSRSAWAQDLGCDPANDLPLFINLQLAGGPALFANHLAAGRNGQTLEKSGILGVGPGAQTEALFKNGAPFYRQVATQPGSGFVRGLRNVMGADFDTIIGTPAASQSVFVAVSCKSVDDRLDNKHDLSGMLSKAGLGGTDLPYLLVETTSQSPSANDLGSLRFAPAVYPVPTYLRSVNREAIEAALGFKGALMTNLTAGNVSNGQLQAELMTAINSLTQAQAKSLIEDPRSSTSRKLSAKLAQCAYQKSKKVVDGQANRNLDISTDTLISPIWNRTFTSDAFSAAFKANVSRVIGTSVDAACKGLSSAVTAVIGAYDYHDGQVPNRAASDQKDVYFGQIVGQILLNCKARNRKVFLYISSDGSVSSPVNESTPPDVLWRADYSERAMNYIIAYDPESPTTLTARGHAGTDAAFQLNHFTTQPGGQDYVVSTANPIGGTENQDLAAAAVFLNYLGFAGQANRINNSNLIVVKKKLEDAIPGAQTDLFTYYQRIYRG